MRYQPFVIGFFGLALILAMSSCGGASSAASPSIAGGAGPVVVTPGVNTYVFHVHTLGVTYAADIFTNFGAASQQEAATGSHAIVDVSGFEDITVFGTDTVAQFANQGGGTLTVELYKNGSMVQSKSETNAGFSISFNQDI